MQVLSKLPVIRHPDLLVGTESMADAAIYRLDDETALVLTVDFFPPIVDDPYAFGAIAVANSVSDVYAMGGKPLLALNIVGFPVELDKSILTAVLLGAYDKAHEAGLLIVGGHTVDDKEPKYGLAVTGIVKPGKHVTNSHAQPGDVLVLTKPIGTGIIATAAKVDACPPEVLASAVKWMSTLNKNASEVMVEVGVNAATDVTGFGLIGHLHNICEGSQVGARISFAQVPLMDGAWDLVDMGIAPGGTGRNVAAANKYVDWDPTVDPLACLVVCDPQTSGGLLIAVAPEKRDALIAALAARGVPGVVVGSIVADADRRIAVVP